MAKELFATERRELPAVIDRLDQMERWMPKVLARLRPWLPLEPGDRILDMGAAQGATVTAFTKAGFDAVGVEPFPPAIEVSRQLQAVTNIPIDIREGFAERLPFPDNSFRYVHAISLMEHVEDPVQVFREAYRVLVPGGGIYFKTAGVLHPRQSEIRGFPLFPWYPRPLQRRVMLWARDNRPSWVGGTTRPALHFYRRREVQRWLYEIGFSQVVDRWTIHRESGQHEHSRAEQTLVTLASQYRPIRVTADVLKRGLEYLAIK